MTGAPRRSLLMAVGRLIGTVVLAGAALGAVWALIAPPIHTVTALTHSGARVDAFLGKEADNLFVAVTIMLGLLSFLAVVSAVAVWQCRAHRGPALVAALWVGQVAAAAAATGLGTGLAHWRYGTADHAGVELSPQNRVAYFTEAPPVFAGHHPLQIALTLLLPAALAALTYGFLAGASSRADLGR